MDKLIRSLIALGLTEKEAKIYLTLYKLKEATSYQIAKESGIKRPTVYVIMEQLRKRGLALVIPHAKKQLYIAKSPHEFIQEFQAKVNKEGYDLLASLPKLSKPTDEILVFKGKGALVQGLSYGLNSIKEKEIIAFYAAVKKDAKVSDKYLEHYTDIHKAGFTLRGISPSTSDDSSFREEDKKYGYHVKRIPHEIFSPAVSTEVCGSLVKTIFHKNNQVLVVDDKGLADFYRQVFNQFWNLK